MLCAILLAICANSTNGITFSDLKKSINKYAMADNGSGGKIVLTFHQQFCEPWKDKVHTDLYDGISYSKNGEVLYFCWTHFPATEYVEVVYMKDGDRREYDLKMFDLYNQDGSKFVAEEDKAREQGQNSKQGGSENSFVPPFWIGALTGVCTEYVVDRVDRTGICGDTLIYLRQQNGGHAFTFNTMDKSPLAFSGGKLVSEGDSAYLVIERIMVSFNESTQEAKFADVKGKCVIWGSFYRPKKIRCNSTGNGLGTTKSVEFTVNSEWKDTQ
jgi:hypothetical protein